MSNERLVGDKYEPRFDLDLAYGRQGELQIGDFLDWLAKGDGRVEVKRKRILDHRIFVETHHDPGRTGVYKPSGISTTAAQVWCVVIGDTGIHVAIPTDLLRAMVDDPSSKPVTQDAGTCPSRGVLVDFCVLLFREKQRREAPAATASRPADPAPAMTAADIRWGTK